MEIPHVLVVHHEPAVRQLVAESLGQDRVRVSLACNGGEGLSLLERDRVHALVTSLDVLGVDHEFLRQAASIHPLLGVALLVNAVPTDNRADPRQPAQFQYLPKPVTQDSLRSAIGRALEREMGRRPASGAGLETAAAAGASGVEAFFETGRIVAKSRAMREILELVRKAAPTDFPVLICGEPDTGKELIAREIHRQSRRAAWPFVRVACGALREPELTEKLFGRHQRTLDRGSQPSLTLLEEAQGGTLFLENVSLLPLWSQLKLLDILQQGWYLHARSAQSEALDVRVIASTAANLHAATAERAFSSRLYHYLNVVQIHVPPLRHRPQDIPPLAETCLELANSMRVRQAAKVPCRFTEGALQCLLEYDWPGNTLQLASVVAHAALLADDGEIGRARIAESFGGFVPESDPDTIPVPLAGGLKQIERAVIEAVIERCRGNKAAAARALRLHRRTLYRILQEDTPAKEDAMPLPFTLAPSISDYSASSITGNQP